MKEVFVRISAWFAIIFYFIMSLVSLTIIFSEKIDFGGVMTFFMFLFMSFTGLYARKFGLKNFRIYNFSKPLAAITLIFGVLFLVLVPILFTTLFSFDNSYLAIISLFVLFSPAVISAVAILSVKSKNRNGNILQD